MGRSWARSLVRTAFNPIGAAGDLIGGKTGEVMNAVGNPAGVAYSALPQDVRSSISKGTDELIYRSTDPLGHLSGGDQIDSALKDQQAYNDKGVGQINASYQDAKGLMSPYQQGGAQNFQDMQGMVRNGAFNPQYQGYQGLMSGGVSNPMFQGPAGGVNPQFQGMDGGVNPQFQGYSGPMSAGNVNPQYQGYQGPMTSGQQAPQFQQYGGPSQFNAQARPERMAGTTENVNMFQDPGYQFRLQQGIGAIEGSAAARGLLGSSATLQGINDYAQNAASQEFGNAYGRMQQNQANRQQDFESDRGFNQNNFGQNFQRGYGMSQDQNNFNMNAAGFNQNAFEGDRAFGFNAGQAANQFGQQNADRTLQAFQGDRAAGMMQSGQQNDFNQQNAGRGLQYTGMQNDFNQQNAGRGLQYAGMQNDFNQQNAARTQQGNQFDMNFGYGMNQDLNNWNANQAQNNYGMWNNMVGMGYNAASQGANLATGYGQNLSEMYAGQGNAAAAAAMAKANARNGMLGQGASLLGGLFGG